MNETFKMLLESATLWLPALTWLLGQLSATRTGIKIEEGIKKRLKWIKDPEAEKAFQEAFNSGVQKYQKKEANNESALVMAKVLIHVANHDTSGLDRAAILEQIFLDRMDIEAISGIVSRHIFAIEGSIISKDIVAKELRYFIGSYLKPAFLSQKYFAEVVGFAEVIGLLKDIKEEINPPVNLDTLQKDYYRKIAYKYELLTMQGISPKVQNRTIGIKMKDVFISLEATPIRSSERIRSWLAAQKNWRELLNDELHQRKTFSADLDDYLNNFLHVMDDNLSIKSKLYEKIGALEIREKLASINTITKFALKSVGGLEGLLDFGLKDIVNTPQIVIQGHPGSGKSTIIKYISWAISTSNTEIIGKEMLDLIPIPIRAIEFGESLEKGLVSSLDEYILEKDINYAPLFRFAVSAGKAYIFIDGLDEVGQPSLRSRVKERVDDFVADPAYIDNHILITTRIVGYQPDGITGKFPHFELKELDEKQISKFVENWYKVIYEELPSSTGVETEKKQLLDAVLKNPSIHRMAQNPLLLTIIALIKWQGRALPEQRVLLYDAAAQTLIKSWPLTQRAVEFDELFIREWLAPIAEKIFSNPTSDLIDEYSLSEELVESMMTLKSLTKLDAKAQTQELLESISVHSGIILPRGVDEDGRNLYGFLHQTFAEYLTAYHFAGKWEDGYLDLANYAHDPYWREVLLLMAGHLGIQRRAKAGQLLGAILELNPLPFEEVVCRNIVLSGRILGDSVPAPADVVEKILASLVELWKSTKYTQTRVDVENVFKLIKTTEYSSVLARIAISKDLDDSQMLSIAGNVGPNLFVGRLQKTLQSNDPKIKLNSAILLAELGDLLGQETLLDLLNNTNDLMTVSAIYKSFIKSNNLKNIISILERLASLFNVQDITWLSYKLSLRDSLEELKKIFENENASLSQQARWMLAILLPNFSKSDIYLLECMDSSLEWYSFHAAKELAGKQNNIGVEKIVKLMMLSKNESVRLRAALFLGEIKRNEAIPALHSILEGPQQEDRIEAARRLFENFDDLRGRMALQDFVKTGDQAFALNAEKILRKAPGFSVNKEYIDLLLSNSNPLARIDLAVQLASDDVQEGVDYLVECINKDNVEMRLEAAEKWIALEKKDSQIAENVASKMIDLLAVDDLKTEFKAAKILAKLGRREGFDKLENLINCHDHQVRFTAVFHLFSMRSNKSAFDILKNNISKLLLDFETYPLPEAATIHSIADIASMFVREKLKVSGEFVLGEK